MKKIIVLLLITFAVIYADTPNTCDILVAEPKNKTNPPSIKSVAFSKMDSKKAINACLKAIKDFPNEPKYIYRLGRAYEKAKDKKNAFKWYMKAAARGNAQAQYNIGFIYSNIWSAQTWGIKGNTKLAFKWYTKAAEQGNSNALFSLALMYNYGLGVTRDYKKAFKIFLKVGQQGNPTSQMKIGDMYYNGEGVKKDDKEAFKWYLKVAEQQYNIAVQKKVATMYYVGKGVKQNYKKAFSWYMKVAKQGDTFSQYMIGDMYYVGKWVTKNYKKAFMWLMKAAKQGDADSQSLIGEMYDKGRYVKQNYKKAFKWYMKAAEQGEANAQNSIGVLYHFGLGGVTKNYKKAFNWRIKAAIQGYVPAQGVVGIMYQNGIGVKKNYIKAYAWLSRAAANGDTDASEFLNNLEKKMTSQQIAIAQSYDPLKENTEVEKKPETKQTESSQTYTGTGFFVDKSTVLTNNHVVKNCRSIELVRKGYKSAAKIKAKDSINDLAILEADKTNGSSLNFRGGKGIRIGNDIIVIGYPLGNLLGSSIKLTTGNISAVTGLMNDTREMQLTAPVQPGNSGGALLDESGNVVGVIVARLKNEQNVNLAIKSNVAQMFLDINNINYSVAMSKDKKDVADIADEAKKSIVQVLCHQ